MAYINGKITCPGCGVEATYAITEDNTGVEVRFACGVFIQVPPDHNLRLVSG